MSQENVEIVRRGFEGFIRTGDFDPEDFDPEFEFDNSNSLMDPSIYSGTEGLHKFLTLMREMWKQLRFEPQEFIPVAEDQVIVPVRLIAVGRDGVETVARAASIFTLREGKVTHSRSFQSKADALAAVGLRE